MTHLSPIENLFAVEVPDDALNFRVDVWFKGEANISYHSGGKLFGGEYLPPGSYEILFTTKGCTEGQAAGVVEKEPGYYDTYREYERDGPWVNDIAVNSLHSLLRTNGLDESKNFLLIKKIA